MEELCLSYDLKILPFPPRALAKDYKAVNPLGTVPYLIDGETRMTESAAICQYLGTRHGPSPLVVGADEPAYGAFLNWLHFGEATLTFPQTLVLRYSRLEPQERRSEQIATDYSKWFFGRLRAVEAALDQTPTLCANRFTAADISVGYALRLAESIGLATDFGPNVAAYWQRLQQRDGYKRAVAAENAAAERLNDSVSP
jgi:glutathione S-transferase